MVFRVKLGVIIGILLSKATSIKGITVFSRHNGNSKLAGGVNELFMRDLYCYCPRLLSYCSTCLLQCAQGSGPAHEGRQCMRARAPTYVSCGQIYRLCSLAQPRAHYHANSTARRESLAARYIYRPMWGSLRLAPN